MIANYMYYSTLETINKELLRKADGRLGYSVISIRRRLMDVWTVSLLLLRSSRYVRHLTFIVWALDMIYTVC